jgi:hypothetical protein
MVDSVKNYGIAGVSANVELGKQGAQIIGSDSSQISLQDKDGNATVIAIADGTDASHGVTKSQYDDIILPKLSYNKSSIEFNSGNVTVGTMSANTTVHTVVVESTSGTWTDENSSTEVTVGDDSEVDRLFAGFDSSAQVKVEPKHKYTSDTDVKIYVTQGGASAGSGTVTIWYSGTIS